MKTTTTRQVSFLLIWALMFALLAGCSDNSESWENDGTHSPAGVSQSSDRGFDSLTGSEDSRPLKMTMFMGIDISSLDPYIMTGGTSTLLAHSLFDVPWVIDKNFKVQYRVASGYDVSEDGLIYTVYLRDNATFHDGTPITAEDVAYSAEMCKSSPVLSDWAGYFDTVKAVDDTTVQITLTQPYAPIINAMKDMFIVSKAAHDAAGQDFGYEPLGSGPYKLKQYIAGNSVTLEAYEEYYLGAASIKTVVYFLISDASTVSMALENKTIDYSDMYLGTDSEQLQAMDHLQFVTAESTSLYYMIFNCSKEPFNNPLVRQALNCAINRQEIADENFYGFFTPSGNLVNDQVFGYSEIADWEYDPQQAKALLAEAGYPNGEGFPMTPLYIISGEEKLAKIVQDNLKDVGLNFPIEVVDISLLLQYIDSGVCDTALMSLDMGTEPAAYSNLLTTGAELNFAHYSNPEVDRLFDKASTTSGLKTREAIYKQIWDIYQQDAPYCVFGHQNATVICSADLDVSALDTYAPFASSHILPYYLKWK